MKIPPFIACIGLTFCLLPHSSVAQPQTQATALIEAARAQINVTRFYDGSYQRLTYPGGDVDIERGVCTDAIIRAYRQALEHDLQQAVHEDMRNAFSRYPNLWGLKQPDRNIDHRRVPNLQTFFNRRGAKLSGQDYQPGDLVTQMINGKLPHIVIVSDKLNKDRTRYLVIHNIGNGAQEEDVLNVFPVTGHYRYFP